MTGKRRRRRWRWFRIDRGGGTGCYPLALPAVAPTTMTMMTMMTMMMRDIMMRRDR